MSPWAVAAVIALLASGTGFACYRWGFSAGEKAGRTRAILSYSKEVERLQAVRRDHLKTIDKLRRKLQLSPEGQAWLDRWS